MNYLAPSILSADYTVLGEQICKLEQAGVPYMHIDVMDGMFVPSISIGLPVIKSIRKSTNTVFDVHLMIEEPIRYIDEFASAGADIITVHAEACHHLDRTIAAIKSTGKKVGIALNPATSLSVLEYILPEVDMVLLMSVNPGFGGQSYIPYVTEKIKTLHAMVEEKGLEIDIEVDGGVNLDNAREIVEAGANVIVAGTAVFKGDLIENAKQFLNILGE